MSAGEAAGALRAGCCQSCREHSSVPEAVPCERGMTEFPCLTGGRRPAAAGRAEKTPPGSSPWAQQSRQGEPWPPPAAATWPPRLGATAALGTGNPMGKQGVGGGKDAGSGHRRAAGPEAPSRRERPWAAGLCQLRLRSLPRRGGSKGCSELGRNAASAGSLLRGWVRAPAGENRPAAEYVGKGLGVERAFPRFFHRKQARREC